MSAARIAVVLPAREAFTQARSGAVALSLRDFARFSRFSDQIEFFGADACDYGDVRYRRLSGFRRWWRRPRAAYADAVAAAAAPFALIEVQNRPYMISTLRRRCKAAKLTLHIHNDPQSMDGSRSRGERAKLLRDCDAIYCVSDYVRARFLDGIADEQAKAVTVYCGLEPLAAPGTKAPIVVFAGRVIAIKGAAELARAFKVADLRGWRLVIAGGDFAGLLKDLSGDDIEVTGQLPHAEVMNLLARAEIAAVPSLWEEPFGRAALEALASGCALVTTRRGGLPEIAEGAALFVDPEDIEGFANALKTLADDESLRRRLQASGRARVRERFGMGVSVARLDAVRARLLGEG